MDNYRRIKLILLGDVGVGKTSTIMRYCENTYIHDNTSTIGIDFYVKSIMIKDIEYRLNIWDAGGQDRFRSIIHSYYRGSHGAIFVYDTTNRTSFENITQWIEDFRNKNPDSPSLIIIGNKSDLINRRTVTYEEGKSLCDLHNCQFFETSALNDENVTLAIRSLLEEIIEKLPVDNNLHTSINLNHNIKNTCKCQI